MHIQYRLFSEHSIWRCLEINKNYNYILVGELKNILCKQNNINYNNKIDIFLSFYKNNIDENEITFLNNEEKVMNGNKILVHRKIRKKNVVSDIYHNAKKEVILNVEEKEKNILPVEILCKICNLLLHESYIIVCNYNCGYSACKNCILFYILNFLIKENEKKTKYIDLCLLNENIKCPTCNKGYIKYCILNKTIEMTLKTVKNERMDIDPYHFNIEERNNRFYKLLEKLKIENFDYSNKNIFENNILKIIEKKFILLNEHEINNFGESEKKTDKYINEAINNEQNDNINNYIINEKSKIFNNFLYLLDNHKLNCIRQYNLIYIDYDSIMFDSLKKCNKKLDKIDIYHLNENKKTYSIIENNICENTSNQLFNIEKKKNIKELNNITLDDDKIYFIPLSYAGGDTSYCLIGVFYIKEIFDIRFDEYKKDQMNETDEIQNEKEIEKYNIAKIFLTKWFLNDTENIQNNILENLNNGNIYIVEYVNKYEQTCFFPAKKQPLYRIISCIDDYIKYGSRPFCEDTKKKNIENLDKEEQNDLLNEHLNIQNFSVNFTNSKYIKNLNDFNSKELMSENFVQSNFNHKKENKFQQVLQMFYETKIVPLSLQEENWNIHNPYVGYCALLPFLTKEDFNVYRQLQRICKEKYLKKLYKHIKKNNLSINIFYNAMNAIFFSTIKQ